MKDVLPSPKKRLPKQKSPGQKHIPQHNEDEGNCDAGSNKEFAWDKPITDITIPNVIPAPSSAVAVSKLEKCNIEEDDLQAVARLLQYGPIRRNRLVDPIQRPDL